MGYLKRLSSTVAKKGWQDSSADYHDAVSLTLVTQMEKIAAEREQHHSLQVLQVSLALVVLGKAEIRFFCCHPNVNMDLSGLCRLLHILLKLQSNLLSKEDWIEAEGRRRIASVYEATLQPLLEDAGEGGLPTSDMFRLKTSLLNDDIKKSAYKEGNVQSNFLMCCLKSKHFLSVPTQKKRKRIPKRRRGNS